MKIYSNVRLILAEEHELTDVKYLSDSTLYKVANDPKDTRNNAAQKEIEKRTGRKSDSRSDSSKASDSETKSLDLMKSPTMKSKKDMNMLERWSYKRKTSNEIDDIDKQIKKHRKKVDKSAKKINKLDNRYHNYLNTHNRHYLTGPARWKFYRPFDFLWTSEPRTRQLDYITKERKFNREDRDYYSNEAEKSRRRLEELQKQRDRLSKELESIGD